MWKKLAGGTALGVGGLTSDVAVAAVAAGRDDAADRTGCSHVISSLEERSIGVIAWHCSSRGLFRDAASARSRETRDAAPASSAAAIAGGDRLALMS